MTTECAVAWSPEQDPEVLRMVRPLLRALTSPDECLRQAAVRGVLSCSSRTAALHVIRQLARLLSSRDAAVSGRAGVSLAEVGLAAVPALMLLLCRSRSVPGRVHAAQVLAVIGRTLEPAPRRHLATHLLVLRRAARAPDVAGALDRARAALLAPESFQKS
jgi:hypothetical protein